jgi:hypothetical protein
MLVPGAQAYKRTLQSAAVATGNGTPVTVTAGGEGGYATLTVQVVGITTATITWEGTVDGTNWVAILATPLTTGTAATTATADGIYRINVTGLASVRARISAWTSGTITVTAYMVAI